MARFSDKLFDPKVMAKSLETYLSMFDRYVVKTDLTAEEYEKAKKRVKKLIKHLKNDEIEKVVDPERYEEALQVYEESGRGGVY